MKKSKTNYPRKKKKHTAGVLKTTGLLLAGTAVVPGFPKEVQAAWADTKASRKTR